MNQGPSSPPGWYPTPDGHQRYWDGGQWLAIPPPEPGPGPSKRRRTIVLFVATLVLAAIVGGGLALLLEQREARQEAAEASAAAASAAEESRQAAEEESARAAEESASAAAAEQASTEAAAREEAAQEDAARQWRNDVVEEVEAAIQTMAEGDLEDGLIGGDEVSDVSCSPVAGGSVGDLDQETTALQCFASTEENDDGTWSGYYYESTVNWTTGEYTYGPAQQ